MIRRLLVAGLLLVAACGSDDDPEPVGGSPDAGAQVQVSFDEPLRPGPVTWEVELTAGEALELTFPTGQRADVSLSQGGEVVYQWSRAQLFTQEVGSLQLAADQVRTFSLEDVLEVDPGDYELEAWITAEGRDDLRTTQQVTVEPR